MEAYPPACKVIRVCVNLIITVMQCRIVNLCMCTLLCMILDHRELALHASHEHSGTAAKIHWPFTKLYYLHDYSTTGQIILQSNSLH